MNKNIIIIGAGPNLSFGVAEKFAENGFSIGLISRNEDNLKLLMANLNRKGVNTTYTVADAYDTIQLENALKKLTEELGSVDVLVYNAAAMKHKNILSETTQDLVDDFRLSVGNAFNSIKVLHEQLKKTGGAVLITGGGLAHEPNPDFGSLSIAKAALLSLTIQLNEVLKPNNIYVGILTINGSIKPDSETYSPKKLGEKYWEMYVNRINAEEQI